MIWGLGMALVLGFPGASTLQLIIKAMNIALNWSNKIPLPAIRAPRSSREYKLYCNETSLLQACWETTCSTGSSFDTSNRDTVNFRVCSNIFIASSTKSAYSADYVANWEGGGEDHR